mgnify:FL=1
MGVNATNTTDVRVELVNSSAATAGSLAAENAEEGDFIGISAVSVDGEYVPVFSQSASDVDWIDTDEDTYATLDSEGDTVTVHNVDEMVEESGDVEVSTKVNDGLGFGNARSMLSGYDSLSFGDRLSLAFDANNFNGNPFESED